MKISTIHSGACDARGLSRSFSFCSPWKRNNHETVELWKARTQSHLRRNRWGLRYMRVTFLRYIVSSVFGICFGAIWPLSGLGAECLLWISTSSHKALFLLMTLELPQWADDGKYQNRGSTRKAETCDSHCLSLKHELKKLNQMNERVREKEKAELLSYKGNIWESKERVLVDNRTQEPGLRGTVSMCAELSISVVQPWEFTCQHTAHSNPQSLFTRGKKNLKTKVKNHIPGGQNNLISSPRYLENGELMCLPEEMIQNPGQQHLSDHWKDKWVLADRSGTPWRELYPYFCLSPINVTPAKGFKKQGGKGKLSRGCGVCSMLNGL